MTRLMPLALALAAAACATTTPVALPASVATGGDKDCDGLSDATEQRLGTDPERRDSDGDGLDDGLELGRVVVADGCASRSRAFATVTSPLLKDSDGDGLHDGVEDVNRDGRRNHGETSPRRQDSDGDGTDDLAEVLAGTNPSRDLEVPEPLVFDLVRGLKSRQGELEINTLVQVVPIKGGGVDLVYAPEIEYAVADGLAVELELPFHHDRLEAIKVALQHTLGVDPRDRFAHGWQAFAEVAVDGTHADVVVSHVGNLRPIDRLALVTIAGAALSAPLDGIGDDDELARLGERLAAGIVVNESLHWLVDRTFSVGLEVNTRTPVAPEMADVVDGFTWRVMPQIHAQVNHHLRLQMGLGVAGVGHGGGVVGAARVIGEL